MSFDKLDKNDLKKHGLKITLPRLKILTLLEQSATHHMSAEDIYKALLASGEDVGLATVYRVLLQFESAGLVVKHHFGNEHAVFELNDGDHHDHLVCVGCGDVVEFCDPIIEDRQLTIAKEKGYQIGSSLSLFYGTCTLVRRNQIFALMGLAPPIRLNQTFRLSLKF